MWCLFKATGTHGSDIGGLSHSRRGRPRENFLAELGASRGDEYSWEWEKIFRDESGGEGEQAANIRDTAFSASKLREDGSTVRVVGSHSGDDDVDGPEEPQFLIGEECWEAYSVGVTVSVLVSRLGMSSSDKQ